jgi:uncharacterized membrane protein YheB (UPF0754 family)
MQWIAPPLVGAVIGYVTNAIAIKMLFRPLEEVRFFGLRVPFTPGILPRQRRRLARNIGNMVSRELLTESIIRERLRAPEFRVLVEKSVSEYTSLLLDSSLSRTTASFSDLGAAVGSVVERFVASEAFSSLVRSVVRHSFLGIGNRSLSDLVGSPSGAIPDAQRLMSRFLSSLATPEVERKLAEAIEVFLAESAAAGKSLGECLPGDLESGSLRLADALYPVAAEAALRFLNQPDTRRDLEAKGQVILRDALLELNSLQRFFVSAAQYDKTLAERMPSIVDSFVDRVEETLRATDTRFRFAETVEDGVSRMLALPLDEALSRLKTDRSDAARTIAARLLNLARDGGIESGPWKLLSDAFAGLGKERVESIVRNRLGLDPLALADMASYALVSYVRSECAESVSRLVNGFLQERGEEPVSSLLGVGAAEKAAWDAAIAGKTIALIDERVSAVIESLDVSVMVSDRIDSLDMEDVERIVLDVLSDQLKWIDIFGAFLGALMGLSQAVLNVLIR